MTEGGKSPVWLSLRSWNHYFNEYMGDREDTAKGIIELMELGLKTWKLGQKAAHITARHAARGRLAQQICRVEICPCRIDFS